LQVKIILVVFSLVSDFADKLLFLDLCLLASLSSDAGIQSDSVLSIDAQLLLGTKLKQTTGILLINPTKRLADMSILLLSEVCEVVSDQFYMNLAVLLAVLLQVFEFDVGDPVLL
jgi:hypothetical protein